MDPSEQSNNRSDDYLEWLETVGIKETVVDQRPGDTIVPRTSRPADSHITYDPLPRFEAESLDNPRQLSLGEVIGEGGMGVVQLAVQVPLGRQVAVKMLRPQKLNSAGKRELLREAWLTGALEHPNIIPVYNLGESESGSPMLVMKRVEGVSWRDYLNDASRLQDDKQIDDPLTWHLKTMIQVCQAVHFAHSKGIIHRDLKPENVMIGAFGEVYVLDWGIAVSMLETDEGRLPLARDVKGVAGTPYYMAPEMAEGKGALIAETTDVYLLGALLHEIVTGECRHQGNSVIEILQSAFRSRPVQYARAVPPELAKICNKATCRKPDERYSSVEEFRRALEWYLNHRDSLQLSTEANQRLTALLGGVEMIGEQPELESGIYDAFAECRFGFMQALKTCPENSDATKGLQLAYRSMVEYEISNRDHKAAARLLQEMPEAARDLEPKVQQLAATATSRDAELERLKFEQDLSQGTRTRAFLAFITGIVWALVPLVLSVLRRLDIFHMTPIRYVKASAIFAATLGVGTYWARESMFKTEVNRRIVYALAVVLVTQIILRLTTVALGIPMFHSIAMEMVLYGMAILMIAATIDRRILPAGVIYLVATLIAAVLPDAIYEIMSVANMIAMFSLALIWSPKEWFPSNSTSRFGRMIRRRQGKL